MGLPWGAAMLHCALTTLLCHPGGALGQLTVRFSGLGAPMSLCKTSTTLPRAETQTDTVAFGSQRKAEHLGLRNHLYMSYFLTNINTHFQAEAGEADSSGDSGCCVKGVQ